MSEARTLELVMQSAARVERDRIYKGVLGLYLGTTDKTSNGKAQRVAYRRVLTVIKNKPTGFVTGNGETLVT